MRSHEVATYAEHAANDKKIKVRNNPWPVAKSQKRRKVNTRASVRDSKRTYRARVMQPRYMVEYTHFRDAILSHLQRL